jgi:hypothetical protein
MAVNEDNSHFYGHHPAQDMNAGGVERWVSHYGGTQVGEIMLCPNSQRSSVASSVRQSNWDGFDPESGNDQPFFGGIPDRPMWENGPTARALMRHWVENALSLHRQGIDLYAFTIPRFRALGISPWISMRMNDVHYVDQPTHPIHDRFWREHPEFRRCPDTDPYNGQCLDYGIPEVRDYQMAYLQEIVGRYDLDGLELDWMRNPFHFRPGFEEMGLETLTAFVRDVRALVARRAVDLGHPVKLGVRVPSRPQTARLLGLDAPRWAREGLVDKLVVTPFLFTEFDVPVELWKQLCAGTGVTVATGIEVTLRPYEGAAALANNLESLRGVASGLLARGADQIYLFNFMDRTPTEGSEAAYRRALGEIGDLRSMDGLSRRHVVTVPDTFGPGEPRAAPLPASLEPGRRTEFRVHAGPAMRSGQRAEVRVCLRPDPGGHTVTVNGARCGSPRAVAPPPGWKAPDTAFVVPPGVLHQGMNAVSVGTASEGRTRLEWVEVAISDSSGRWPSGGIEQQSLWPEG